MEEIKITCEECLHCEVCKNREDNTNPRDCEQFIAKKFIGEGMTAARASAQFAVDIIQLLGISIDEVTKEDKE